MEPEDYIRTWFVTGASSGVGLALCEELLRRGYNVIAVSRRVPGLEHRNALCLSVDVTRPETIQTAVEKGIERFGRIDVLSNNAGISAYRTCEEETWEHMLRVMETNFGGTFNTVNALLPHFRQNGHGTIINNSSQSGLSPRYGGSAYCSSKHAVEGFTSVLRHETQRFCRVLAVELGGFPGTAIEDIPREKTKFPEYDGLPPAHPLGFRPFKNQLGVAINCIIDEVEKERMQRRLVLGRDAIVKIDCEIKALRQDWKKSKRRALACSRPTGPCWKTIGKYIHSRLRYAKYLLCLLRNRLLRRG